MPLKELRHDILSHSFDGLNNGNSVGNNGLLRKKNSKGVILEQKGTRMGRLKRIGKDDFENFSQLFSKYTNGDVAPIKENTRILSPLLIPVSLNPVSPVPGCRSFCPAKCEL